MARLEATNAMRDGLPEAKSKATEAMDERAREAGFADHADYLAQRKAARVEVEAKRQAALVSSPEFKAAQERLAVLRQYEQSLARSIHGQQIDAFTAMVRGIEINGKDIRALAPSTELYRLYRPARGDGMITLAELAAGAHYSYLNDATKVGSSSYDLSDPRVDGGGGGDTEMSVINHCSAAGDLREAKEAFFRWLPRPKAVTIRKLVNWVCLDGGQPIDNFSIDPDREERRDPVRVRAIKCTMLSIGLSVLSQHFGKGTG